MCVRLPGDDLNPQWVELRRRNCGSRRPIELGRDGLSLLVRMWFIPILAAVVASGPGASLSFSLHPLQSVELRYLLPNLLRVVLYVLNSSNRPILGLVINAANAGKDAGAKSGGRLRLLLWRRALHYGRGDSVDSVLSSRRRSETRRMFSETFFLCRRYRSSASSRSAVSEMNCAFVLSNIKRGRYRILQSSKRMPSVAAASRVRGELKFRV